MQVLLFGLMFFSGDINRVIYPTDSQGRICGVGDLQDRPNLLFFDLTKCLNLGVLAHGCVTPQVRTPTLSDLLIFTIASLL